MLIEVALCVFHVNGVLSVTLDPSEGIGSGWFVDGEMNQHIVFIMFNSLADICFH